MALETTSRAARAPAPRTRLESRHTRDTRTAKNAPRVYYPTHRGTPTRMSSQLSRNAHEILRLGPSAGRKEAAAPNFHARARALMVLERPSAKQPAASQPTAARWPQRRRSCLGSRFQIFSMKPAHLNKGWRTTAVDVSAASGAHSTPTPTPSPLTISPLSRQASP